jgi:ankyrin repeat protein
MNLLSSCLEGDLSKVKYFAVLFEIDSKDFYGNTGLALSVKKGHKQVAEYLLSKGASPNSKNHVLTT